MLNLKDNEKVTYTLEADDSAGNIAIPFPAPPVWSVSDATLLAVSAAADGLTAVVSAVGPEGTALVQVSATNSDGSAVAGTDSITIGPSAAIAIKLTPGTPSLK
jgi:hypothetical protein